jgi:aminobenzoyl-glutamate transport protein
MTPGITVDYKQLDEKSYTIETRSIKARGLLTIEGIRFIYISLIPNFMSFTAVGLMIAAMVGAGVAEESGTS